MSSFLLDVGIPISVISNHFFKIVLRITDIGKLPSMTMKLI